MVGVASLCVALAAALIEVIAGGLTGEGDAIQSILRVLAVASGVLGVVLTLSRGRARR